MESKKIFILILLSALLILLPIISAKNIEKDINNNSVRVMIKYPEKSENSYKLFSNKSTEGKLNYKYKNIEYKTITRDQFISLKDGGFEISLEPTKQIILQESINLTNSTSVWQIKENLTNITGKGQTICIIDTGIDFGHPDLGGCYGNNNISSNCKIIGGWDFCADDSTCSTEDSIPNDVNGHGTHVSGIVAANGNIKGIAPDAKIVMIKVFNKNGSAYDTNILKGMDWCINNATKFNITVISMSLGNNISHNFYCDNSTTEIEYNPPYMEKINLAKSKNISVAIASGNDGYTEGITSPACIENATRVGSITKSNSLSNFTNRGNFFTDLLLTYGESINSTMPSYDVCMTNATCMEPYETYTNNYAIVSGTSMATPMAAGIIALLKNYKKLESNKTLTNDEIENILINSSTTYIDSASGGNYSIINAYSAILFSDEKSPNITYMFPLNNTLLEPTNQNFTCNATDNLQFKNLTIKIYNSTSLIFNESTTDNSLTVNYTLSFGKYNWSCQAMDNQSNEIMQTYFINVNPIYAEQISPINNTYTNQNKTEFNCSIQSTKELSNITFYLYNSTNLLFNETKIISGLNNYSTFEFNLTNETNYFWNCYGENNESNNYTTENYTLTYDKTTPNISLIYPKNNSRTTTKTITFNYSETEINKNYCNLLINNTIYSSFTQTLSDGIYTWKVSCTDLANNSAHSETFNLEIYSIPSSGGSGGSGGRASLQVPKIYEIRDSDIKFGVIQKIKEKESIKFNIKSKNYNITLNKIEKNQVNITLQPTLQTIILYSNSPVKINFDNDETFDLELILFESDSYANIFIRETNETIPMKHILTEPENLAEPENKTENIELEKTKKTIFLNKLRETIKKIINYLLNKKIYFNLNVAIILALISCSLG